MSEEYPCEEIWDFIKCGGYNSEIDELIIKIMNFLKDNRPAYVTDIAQKLGVDTRLVELVQYIICSLDYADYGTSPRGCWLTEKGNKALELFNKRLKELV